MRQFMLRRTEVIVMKTFFQELYFLFISLLMLSELLAGNMFSLTLGLDRAAELMAVSTETARTHIIILSVFDALAGFGAAAVFFACRNIESSYAVTAGRIGIIATSIGMLLYGSYQLWYAIYQLGDIQEYIKAIGIVYALFGVIAWVIGEDMKREIFFLSKG
jgi:hypothetical protein